MRLIRYAIRPKCNLPYLNKANRERCRCGRHTLTQCHCRLAGMQSELRSLRELRDSALAEAERLRVELKDLRRAFEELLHKNQEEQSTLDKRCNDLWGQLKVKTVELDHARVVSEEAQNLSKQHRLENEMLKKKVHVLNEGMHFLRFISRMSNAVKTNQPISKCLERVMPSRYTW